MTALDTIIGVARVARGKASGMARFGGTTQSFLSSLAPLIAFPLAGAAVLLMRDGPLAAFGLFSATLVAQLAPPVLSHAVAARWGRERQWLHYATAYNWCYWAIPFVAVILMAALGTAMQHGMAAEAAVQAFFLALGFYSLWLHWFLARHGLDLSRWRAAGLVALVNGGTLALAFGPRLLE